jgi:glutaredoxin
MQRTELFRRLTAASSPPSRCHESPHHAKHPDADLRFWNGDYQKFSECAVTRNTSENRVLDDHWSSHLTSSRPLSPPILLLEITCFSELESPRMPDARSVVVYSRKGCHLCEVVKESLSKLSRRGGFTWQEVDVDMDFELRRQFNDEVPVVFIDGRKAFKYHMDEQEFLRKLVS